MFIKESLLAPDEAGCSLRMRCDSCCNRILPDRGSESDGGYKKKKVVTAVTLQICENLFDSDWHSAVSACGGRGKPHPSGTPLALTHPIKVICNILLKPCLILIRDSDAAECVRSQILVVGWFPGAVLVLPVMCWSELGDELKSTHRAVWLSNCLESSWQTCVSTHLHLVLLFIAPGLVLCAS